MHSPWPKYPVHPSMQLSGSGKSSSLNTKRQDVGWQEVGTVSSLGFHETIFIKVLRMFLLTSASPKKNANTPSCQRSLTCNATAVQVIGTSCSGHRRATAPSIRKSCGVPSIAGRTWSPRAPFQWAHRPEEGRRPTGQECTRYKSQGDSTPVENTSHT